MSENEVNNTGLSEAEATLRLIANLPAPEGLAERVQKGLQAVPRNARVLDWPVAAEGSRGWLPVWTRGAAAAAIVCVVAGGAWQISARMAVVGAGNATAAPVRVRPAGGFSSAGAMRTPETLNGPVLTNQGLTKKPQGAKDADAAKKKDWKEKAADAGQR